MSVGELVPRRRHRGLYWAAVLLSIVALVAGAVLAWVGYAATSGPDGTVRGYFQALQRSDAAAALAFGDLPAGPRQLLTGTVLREQQRIAPIRDVAIVSTADTGRAATVTVRYQLGYRDSAQPRTETIALVHRGSWRLARTAIATTVHVQQARARATVVGAAVPSGTVLLFPGAVPVAFDTPYLQLDPTRSSVGFGTGTDNDVTVPVSAAGRSAVGQALAAALKGCFAAAAPAASTCPLPSDRYVPASLAGTLVGDVPAAMRVGLAANSAGVIQIGGQIGFTGRYRVLDFNNIAVPKTGSVDLPLTATAYAVKPIVIRWSAAS
jgi:hypothetical protein